MKKRLLPIGLFSLLIIGFTAFYLIQAMAGDERSGITQKGPGILSSADYLAKIRNNQLTGTLDPRDVVTARKQNEDRTYYKSGKSFSDLNWIEMGPDNIGGRTRALIFDNRDASSMTIYAGGVNGGMFKSTSLGSNWSKINQSNGTENLNVTCMVQDAGGTIYVGTGEGLNTELYSGYSQLGYEGGFVGQGIYKSDASDNFQLVPGTKPVINGDTIEWAYINKLAIDTHGNRLFAATHTGLKYATLPGLSDWQSVNKYLLDSTIISRTITSDSIIVCDSFKIEGGNYIIYGLGNTDYEITQDDTTEVNTLYSQYIPFENPGNCYDVSIGSDGWIISSFMGFVYVSETGDPNKFINKSIYPNNPDDIRKDIINYSTNIVIKDKSGAILHDSTNIYSKEFNWHTNYITLDATVQQILAQYPSSANVGRVSYAIAPSNQSIVYCMAAKSGNPKRNSLFNVYLSEDKGNSWRIIAPGESDALNILGYRYYAVAATDPTLYYRGDYSNTLTVFPDDPYRILAGGVNLWEGVKVQETGYYQWTEKSIGTVINSDGSAQIFNGIFNPLYCHANHHSYVFVPGYSNVFFATTDGGIYGVGYSEPYYVFEAMNKNFNVTQYYSIDISNSIGEVLGGTQNMGSLYISGTGNTPNKGEDLWRPANLDGKYPEGTDGGFVALSNIRSKKDGEDEKLPPSFYSKSPIPKAEALVDRIRRSETLGYDWSINFFSDIGTAPANTNFLTPMVLWESYNNTLSGDSIYFVADKNYSAGDSITVRSNNFRHPFHSVISADLIEGDTLKVQDIISAKFFMATKDNVYMTMQALRFDLNPAWFKISDKSHAGFMDNPSCIAYSADANYLFVGTYEGQIYRISNIAFAYNEDLADVTSSNCIIATSQLDVYEGNTQVITSIAVDPKNANKVLVTLGNYGNSDYVYYSTNALANTPEFNSVQGDPATTGLPTFPVYSSLLEMQPENDMAMVGTEEGIWVSDNVAGGVWYQAGGDIGKVPVMDLKQQTVYKGQFVITIYDPATGEPSYEYFPKIENYGMIYAGTHGRGVFRNETYFTVGEEEHPIAGNSNSLNLNIFPNPASDHISVVFNLSEKSDIVLNVYDLSGRLVYSEAQNDANKGQQKLTINTGSVTRGSYILQLVAGKTTSSSRLIIVK
jgi:hypothetical protein